MITPDSDGPVQPVLIFTADGLPALGALSNDKGFNKSLENGVLWALDGATGRLIPLTDMTDGAGPRVVAALEQAGRGQGSRYIRSQERLGGVIHIHTDLALPGISGLGAAAAPEPANQVPETVQASRAAADLPAAYLYELQDLIRTRKATMPEGSYTTHLFKAGLGKIRKKTGEEAIELILAQSPEETVAEAADLLYHLLVLLVALEIPLDRVFEDLRRR